MANESLVGRTPGLKDVGYSGLKSAIHSETIQFGASSGLLELISGSSKLKAIWESIKWGVYARAGLAGFAIVTGGVLALTAGIRKAVIESGVLQAAIQRLSETKPLTNQFTAFLGSVEAARRRVAELFAFTSNTKFNFGEVANASRTLTIFSQGAQGGYRDLETLGKIATGTGNDLQELAMTFGRFNEQARKGDDIAATATELQHMGVITEATANQLIFLQQSGASSTTVLNEFQSTIKATAAAMGDGGQSVAELQDQIEKLKNEAAVAFGKPWMEEQTNELKRQIVFWQAITPAAAKFGDVLEFTTRPADILKNSMASVAKTDAFKNTLSTMGQMAALLPAVVTGFFAIRGVLTGGIWKVLEGIPKVFSTAVTVAKSASPTALGERTAKLGGTLTEAAAKMGEGAGKTGMEILAKSAMKGSEGLTMLGRGLAVLGTRLLAIVPIVLAIAAATYVAAKAWDSWRDSVARAAHASDLAREALATRGGIDKEIAGLRTMEDRTRLLTKAQEDLNDALREQAAVRADSHASESEVAAAAALVTERRRALRKVEGTETSGLGATSKTLEQKTQQLRIEKEIADIVFQAELARASGGKQAIMLSERLRDNTKLIAEYQKQEAQAPAIAELDRKISAGREARSIEARGLGKEYDNLVEKAAKLQKEISQGGGEHKGGVIELEKQLADTTAQANQVRAQIRGLREQTPGERAAVIEQSKLRSGPEAAQFERLQEEAQTARGKGKGALADQLELESIKLQMKTKADAEKEVAEETQQLEDMRRQGSLRKAELNEHEKLLSITSETYQAQDEAARIQMEAVNRQRALLVDIPASAGGKEAQQARENQIRGFDQQTVQLQNEIDERQRARDREKTALSAISQTRALENTALVAASKGHFAEADAALKAAQQIEDHQSDRERAFQLQQEGWSKEAIATQVAAAAKERQAKRETAATVFRQTEGRRIEELQVEAQAAGVGGALGLPKVDQGAARLQLQQMRDADAFREQLGRNMEALGPGHAQEAAELALKSTTAQVAIENAAKAPGAGSVADTLTRVGGGGGFYAGATGDPSLTLQKRMASLQSEMVFQLRQMNEKKVVVK